MAKVTFRLVMPERELLATEADMVVVPGSEGDFGVLHGLRAADLDRPSGRAPRFSRATRSSSASWSRAASPR